MIVASDAVRGCHGDEGFCHVVGVPNLRPHGVHDILAPLLLVELAVTMIELSPLLESESLTG